MVISVLNYLSSQMTSVDTGDTDISYINHSELIPASVMWPTSHPATTRPDHVIYISLCVTQKGAMVQADWNALFVKHAQIQEVQ